MRLRGFCYQTTAITLIVSVLVLIGLHGPARAGTPQEIISVKSVDVTDLGDRLRVEIKADGDLRYTLATSRSPASVSVIMPGVYPGKALQRRDVNQPPLLEIIPRKLSRPEKGLQVVFRLSAPTPPRISKRPGRLVLDFPKTLAQSSQRARKQAREAPGQAPVSAQKSGLIRTSLSTPGSRKVAAAKKVTRVDVQRGKGGIWVKIIGDGHLAYGAKLVDQGRLVIDLAQLSSALHRTVLPVDHPLLKRIRIGEHSDMVRLVFDLPKPVAYVVRHGDTYVGVHLRGARTPTKSRRSLESPAASDTAARKPTIIVAKEAAKTKKTPEPEPNLNPKKVSKIPQKILAALKNAPSRVVQLTPVGLPAQQPRLGQIGSSYAGSTEPKTYRGRRISMDFQGADISNVLRLIAEVSGLNIVVGQGVKAKVTMRLVDIPWDQALDMLLKMNNLGMVREGNIIWIDTLTNIAKTQEAEAKAQESKIRAEPLVTKVIYVQNVKADEIRNTLTQHLSPRGRLQVNKGTNALVVQDTESTVAEFQGLVKLLDLAAPQVQIEGRIVQADTSYARAFGVQWGFDHFDFSQSGEVFRFVGNPAGSFLEPTRADSIGEFTTDFLVNLPAAVEGLSSVPKVGVQTGRFLGDSVALDLRLSAGELLGLVKTLAAPRITTLDKQEAKIEQGESIPFQTTSLQGTQTTFVDANLALQVTPQITSRDPRDPAKNILMKVKVTRNSVGERSNPAGPSIDKKEASTQVLVRDGETMVIGGIFLDEQRNTVGGVPYLSRIPVLGWLFKNKNENVSKQELLIFLTPSIVS